MDIKENAAYIKGLSDGYEIDKDSKEGKIITQMLDLVSALAERICDLEDECAELREYIEEIDSDLGAVEEDLYVTDEDYDEDFEDDFDDDFVNDDDSGYDELQCPACGEVICVDQNLPLEEVVFPACGERIGDIYICDGDCDACGNVCESVEE